MKSRTLLELHSYDSICLQYTSNTFDIFIIFTFSISISAVFILPVLLASQKPSSGYSLYFNISFVFFFHLSFVELVSFCFCFFILLVFFNSTHIKSLTKYVSIFFSFCVRKCFNILKLCSWHIFSQKNLVAFYLCVGWNESYHILEMGNCFLTNLFLCYWLQFALNVVKNRLDRE